MISLHASAGKYDKVEQLMQWMQKDGCSPESSTYLFLVQAYAESSKYPEAEETIKVMQEKGIPPSCAHLNLLLYALTKAGLIKEAERAYKELSTAGIIPDLACYRTMLRGYMDYGYVEEGIKFFEQIKGSAEADKYIMSAAIHFYRYAGKELEAGNLMESINNLGIPFLKHLEVGSKNEIS